MRVQENRTIKRINSGMILLQLIILAVCPLQVILLFEAGAIFPTIFDQPERQVKKLATLDPSLFYFLLALEIALLSFAFVLYVILRLRIKKLEVQQYGKK